MSCCPPGSWPALTANHTPRFPQPVQLADDGLQGYVAVPAAPTDKAVILVPDIFGPNSGRTKNIADQFSEEGYLTVIPDIFRGDDYPEAEFAQFGEKGPGWAAKFDHALIKRELAKVVQFVQARGAKRVGMMGFCWGNWAIFVALAEASVGSAVQAVVGPHPSLQLEPWVFKGDPVVLAQAVPDTVAVLLLPAANDPDFVKEGGGVVAALQHADSRAATFADMQHGWVNRGDVSKEEVARDVRKALEMASDYFKKHL
mmetsp:Transcript_28803/g.72480  ORF Transcript_28803/g.72480 Transcript_28803/m.72480 type:complete len:257 (-) Transcript_28803:16-786(-)